MLNSHTDITHISLLVGFKSLTKKPNMLNIGLNLPSIIDASILAVRSSRHLEQLKTTQNENNH